MVQSKTPTRLLLERVADGEPGAVNEAIERYGPLVWSLARKSLKDSGQAEDAVQEIFIEVWRNAGRYDSSRSSEATFITVIARRRLIDMWRRKSARVQPEELNEEFLVHHDEAAERLEVCEEADLAAAALDKLKPEQRQVLLLSIREGLSHSQIASALSLPLGTVKSHVRRGLERVSKMLQTPSSPAAKEVTP